MKKIPIVLLLLSVQMVVAQDYRWQQKVDYTMIINFDAATHRFTGEQKLVYTNNSPDTLRKVYYHLHLNAFQPGSMMDVRSRNVVDPDKRIGTRINGLKEDEIGYQKINTLKQDGKAINFRINSTILEVELAKPLLPKGKTTFEMTFETQVPIQVRRTGRNNSEGIAYSMTQWYPKIVEYDYQGWHAYQYVAREFHSVWGDFDVTIHMDPKYVIAATGILQDPDKVGHGYQKEGTTVSPSTKPIKWRFIAKNVIDFAWTADAQYTHDRFQVPGGPLLHFFYQKNQKTEKTWKALQPFSAQVFLFLNKTFGKYPYESYSVIQGGDGGTEYPMCTLVLGEGKFEGLAGTTAHEIAHSWFQAALATNEALYAWMDEGFTTFAGDEALAFAAGVKEDHTGTYRSYFASAANGSLEVANQHSDHFTTNRGYRTGSYTIGSVFLHQLKYVMGEAPFYAAMKRYYNEWKFRHPDPNDFIRVMERSSGLQLHWYMNYWINTIKQIDYEVASADDSEGKLNVTLRRIGEFPMPIDLLVTYKDGATELIYIPLNEMLGSKPVEDKNVKRKELAPWAWVDPGYTFTLERAASQVESLEIDPSLRMADVDRTNNKLVVGKNGKGNPGDN
jgi:hypothetical protein